MIVSNCVFDGISSWGVILYFTNSCTVENSYSRMGLGGAHFSIFGKGENIKFNNNTIIGGNFGLHTIHDHFAKVEVRNNSFHTSRGTDYVMAFEIIEHLYYPDKVLQKIASHLKPGGVLIGSIPNGFSLINRIKLFFAIDQPVPGSFELPLLSHYNGCKK